MNNKKLYIVLDNIKYNNNVGPIFRVSDAVNVTKLFICRKGKERFTNKQLLILKKISRGAIEFVDWELNQDSFSVVNNLKTQGVYIVSIDVRGTKTINNANLEFDRSLAIVFGSESDGIDPNIIHISDEVLKIPMKGKANSLNVASAVAIAMYKLLNID